MSEVWEFKTHFIVMCDDEASFSTDKYVTYINICATAVAFDLGVRGDNIITCKQKFTKFRSC